MRLKPIGHNTLSCHGRRVSHTNTHDVRKKNVVMKRIPAFDSALHRARTNSCGDRKTRTRVASSPYPLGKQGNCRVLFLDVCVCACFVSLFFFELGDDEFALLYVSTPKNDNVWTTFCTSSCPQACFHTSSLANPPWQMLPIVRRAKWSS